MHLCRGNFKSAWAAEGGYEPVAEVLFNELDVDGYFLEYDDARSGDFAPLRFVPKGKTVVLGLVSTKLGQLETKDELKRRIDEAAKFVPLEQLCLSPQCGFSSTVHGNDIAVETQARSCGWSWRRRARCGAASKKNLPRRTHVQAFTRHSGTRRHSPHNPCRRTRSRSDSSFP